MYPDFLCVGFPKCGTTTFYQLLKQHRQIELTRDVKEPQYYYKKSLYKHGFEWYEQRYYGHIQRTNSIVIGEINPSLTNEKCACKISKDFPEDTKFIFLMRNPIDRSYSAFKYLVPVKWFPFKYIYKDIHLGHSKTFDLYINKLLTKSKKEIMLHRNKYTVLALGNYYSCIKEYMKYYPKKNMKFIIFEEFIKNPQKTIKEICEFLNLGEDKYIRYNFKTNEGNKRSRSVLGCYIIGLLYRLYFYLVENFSINISSKYIYRKLIKFYNFMNDFFLIPDKTDKMSNTTKIKLEDYYRVDKNKLQKLIKKDLNQLWFK